MTSPVPLSKSQQSALKKMREYSGVQDLGAYPEATILVLDANYKTLDSTITVLTTLKKTYPDVKLFAEESKKRSKISIERRNRQQASEQAQDKAVTWKDVLAWRDDHWDDLNPQEKLLIALYTMRPPARADYTPMLIVPKKPAKLEDGKNYLIWSKTPYFLFHAYKTHHIYGDIKHSIPARLKRGLDVWIKANPFQTYLLQDETGQPWTPNRLSKAVQRIFMTHHGLKTGITALRHSYLTDYYYGMPSILTLQKVARDMMHSPSVSQQYIHLDNTITHS